MTYVLDRDGIAACPDDPLRVGAPTYIDFDYEQIDTLAADYEHEVYQVIDGYRSTATIAGDSYDVTELFELIFMVDNPETMRLLMAYDRATKERLVSTWCKSMAEKHILGE